MDIRFDARVDTHEFDWWLRQYLEQLKLDAYDVVTTQAKLLFQQLFKFTAPRNMGQGRRAVARDIYRAMRPLDPKKFDNPWIRKAIQQGDLTKLREVQKTVPAWQKWRIEPFSEQLHVRDRRGRVQRSRNVMVVGITKWKRYVSKKQKMVGFTRAQWKGVMSTLGLKVPTWVSRHPASVSSVADYRRQANNPHITAKNAARGLTSDNQFANNLRSALATRVRSMQSDIRFRLTGKGRTRIKKT